MYRAIAFFVAASAGVGGAAMVIKPENVSDAVGLPPDDRVAIAIRVGGVLVLLGAAISALRVLR